MTFLERLSRRGGRMSVWAVLWGYVMLIVARVVDARLTDPTPTAWLTVVFELVIFVIPGLGCAWLMRGQLSWDSLYLTRPSLRHILPCLCAAAGLCGLCLLLTLLICGDSTPTTPFNLYNTFASHGGDGFGDDLRLILCYALLPALCEELMFRGLVCLDCREGGVAQTALVSSLLFGMLHMELKLLPVYIVSGAVLLLVLYATRSLICCIATHFLYNLFAIYLQPYLSSFCLTAGSRTLFLIFAVALTLIAAALFCFSAARLYQGYDSTLAAPDRQSAEAILLSIRDGVLSLPFLLCVAVFAIGVILF